MSRLPRSDLRHAAPLALAGILLLAAALRLVGIRYGLPYPLLNPDEANIVPRAWEMSHGGGLDPGWYDYPSLLMTRLCDSAVVCNRSIASVAIERAVSKPNV